MIQGQYGSSPPKTLGPCSSELSCSWDTAYMVMVRMVVSCHVPLSSLHWMDPSWTKVSFSWLHRVIRYTSFQGRFKVVTNSRTILPSWESISTPLKSRFGYDCVTRTGCPTLVSYSPESPRKKFDYHVWGTMWRGPKRTGAWKGIQKNQERTKTYGWTNQGINHIRKAVFDSGAVHLLAEPLQVIPADATWNKRNTSWTFPVSGSQHCEMPLNSCRLKSPILGAVGYAVIGNLEHPQHSHWYG